MIVLTVVIDTNVVVSAVLRDRIPEMVITFVVSHPEFEWIASRKFVTEYRDVLSRPKFGLPADLLRRWHELLDSSITVIHADASVNFPRDRKDAKFLACATS